MMSNIASVDIASSSGLFFIEGYHTRSTRHVPLGGPVLLKDYVTMSNTMYPIIIKSAEGLGYMAFLESFLMYHQ